MGICSSLPSATLAGHLEVVDWAYRILPKSSELVDICASYVQGGKIVSWWPLWSTGLFTLAVLGLTLWLLERKSF